MKIALIILAVLVACIVVMALVGALLPKNHEASRVATFHQKPAMLYAAARDFAALPTWRGDLKSVELRPPHDGRARYREMSKHGPVTYLVLEDRPGEKLVLQIDDENLPYGGTWTVEFAPTVGGGSVRITERGFVKNVVFRFLARFVFGYTAAMEGYLRDLGKKFGETVTPQP